MKGGRILCLGLFLCLAPLHLVAQCAPDRVILQTMNGVVQFQVEIADSSEKRAQGLMFRDSLAKWSGMLFIYERPGPVSFWMKNTSIALDILFFSEAGVLTHIAKHTKPFSREPIKGGNLVAFVLEINAGMADALRIEENTSMRHPAINPEIAVASCAD